MTSRILFEDLLPRCTGWRSSITSTEAFKLLYNNSGAINQFRLTKRELPLQQVMVNERFVNAIAAHEPGTRLDYNVLREYVPKLRAQFGPALDFLCKHIEPFLEAHDIATEQAARYISFSLHIDVSKAYYQPDFDLPLLKLLPAKTPDELKTYLDEAAAFRLPYNQAILQQKLHKLRHAAEVSMAAFVDYKDSKAMIQSLQDFNDYVTLYDQLNNLGKDQRHLERIEAATKLKRRTEAARAHNAANYKRQIGEVGRHRLRPALVDAILQYNSNFSATCIRGGMTTAQAEEWARQRGLERHPDTWEALGGPTGDEPIAPANTPGTGSTN